jgi:hypothetical protein
MSLPLDLQSIFSKEGIDYVGRIAHGADGASIVDNGIFAYDSTNSTAVLDFIGGRPVINMTNSGSTATDGTQAQVVTGCIQPQAGKDVVLRCAYRGSTASQDFAFGIANLDTSAIASDPTDHIMIRKLAADTKFSLRARKASGTAETWTLDPTVAADTWYDIYIKIRRDVTTAGKGIVEVLINSGRDASANAGLDYTQTMLIATQFPDTVDLAPFFAWRAGSAANVSGYVNYLGWVVQQ